MQVRGTLNSLSGDASRKIALRNGEEEEEERGLSKDLTIRRWRGRGFNQRSEEASQRIVACPGPCSSELFLCHESTDWSEALVELIHNVSTKTKISIREPKRRARLVVTPPTRGGGGGEAPGPCR